MASSNLPSTSPTPGFNSTKPRTPHKVHTPPRQRIDSILETARGRSITMDETEASPRQNQNGFRGNQASEIAKAGAGESSADEETTIFRRSASNRSMNYQSTQTQSNNGLRRKPSTASIRRRGQVPQTSGQQHVDESHEHDDEQQSWWARFVSEYGSLELENKGSVARDHLALERTFLAWLRTSLAFASIGIAITQLFRLNTTAANALSGDPYLRLRQLGKPLGATFIGISIVMLFVGFHRYFESQHWIIRGKFPASRGSIAIVAAITFALMVTSLVVVVVVEPSAFEKR